MTIVAMLKIPLQEGKSEEFLKLMGSVLPDTRAYDGCEGVSTYAQADGQSVLFVEKWASKAHQESYMNWRIETGLMEALEPFVSGPPEAEFYEIRDE